MKNLTNFCKKFCEFPPDTYLKLDAVKMHNLHLFATVI